MFFPNHEQFPIALPAPSELSAPAADMTSPVAIPTSRPITPFDRELAEKPGAGANRIGALLGQDAAREAVVEYRVEVGHVAIEVFSASPADAIRVARTRLCLELPRLWDVIRTMDAARFRVLIVERPG